MQLSGICAGDAVGLGIVTDAVRDGWDACSLDEVIGLAANSASGVGLLDAAGDLDVLTESTRLVG